MITVFLDMDGQILFTYPNVDIRPGDYIKFNNHKYMTVRKMFDADAGCFEVMLQRYGQIDSEEQP